MNPSFRHFFRPWIRAMRRAWLGAGLLAGLIGHSQSIVPALDGWTVTGAPVQFDAAQVPTLPAGAELTKVLPAGATSLRLVSRPYFGTQADGWPTLEVGPSSLSFTRDPAGGAMVLLGDTALPLPFAIVLGEDGRSVQPLDLTLGYDPTARTATLLFGGQSYSTPATVPAESVAVVLAAGREAAWRLEALTVQSEPTPAATSAPGKSGATPAATAKSGPSAGGAADLRPLPEQAVLAAQQRQAYVTADSLFKQKDYAGGEAALTNANRYRPGTLGWQLETAHKLTFAALTLRQQYD